MCWKVRLLASAGYRRSFVIHSEQDGGSTLPGLVWDPDNCREVNGVLYPAPANWYVSNEPPGEEEDKLSMFSASVYRCELAREDVETLNKWMRIPEGVRLFTYVPTEMDICAPDFKHPIKQSLVDAILRAAIHHSLDDRHEFMKEWIDTTDG